MGEEWLRAVQDAAGVERRDAETAAEYLERVGRAVDAPERAAAAAEAYTAATFGPDADLDDDQRGALEAFLAAVRSGSGGGADGREASDAEGPAGDTATAAADAGAPDAGVDQPDPPGRGLEPPVTVPDVTPLESEAGPLAGEEGVLANRRLGELLALLALFVVVAATGVAAATAGPSPAVDGSLAVGVQGGFGGSSGYLTTTGDDWRSGSLAGAFEAEWVSDDRVLTTVMVRNRTDCGSLGAPCAHAGFRVYDVGDDAVVRSWTRPVPNDAAPTVLTATMLPDGTVVLAEPSPDRGGLVAVAPSGTVAWRWDATDHYGSGPGAPSAARLSVTDVEHLDEGRYLLTVAVTDQVLKLQRGVGVVEVVNAASNESVLDGPHDAEVVGPDRIVVADSRHGRVVAMERTATGWRRTWTLDSAGGHPLALPRDVDALAGGTLLVTDSLNDRVVQVSRDGYVHRRLGVPIPYSADAPGERPGRDWTATDGPATPRVAGLTGLYLAAADRGLPYWVDQWLFGVVLVALVVGLGGLAHAAASRRRG